jgi:hypothetical protein
MKRSATRVFLSVAAILCFSSHFAKAQATPQINQFFYPDLLDAKLTVGKDGNTRLIWDFVSKSGHQLYGFSPLGLESRRQPSSDRKS